MAYAVLLRAYILREQHLPPARYTCNRHFEATLWPELYRDIQAWSPIHIQRKRHQRIMTFSTESLSALLDQSLDLINKQVDSEPNNQRSAGSLLLELNRKSRVESCLQPENFSPVISTKDNLKITNHLLDQIAVSTTEQPTYWKGVGPKKSKAKVVKSITSTNGKNYDSVKKQNKNRKGK